MPLNKTHDHPNDEAFNQVYRYLKRIKSDPKLGIINVVCRKIVSQVENVSPEVKKELNSYEVKFELYKKVLWQTISYMLDQKHSYDEKLLDKLFESRNAEELVKSLNEEMQKNPYFALDFLEGAFVTFQSLLPDTQKQHTFVPTKGTKTKELNLEEKRAMAAKLLNLLESQVNPNKKIPSNIQAEDINKEENRNELDQSLLKKVLEYSKDADNYVNISIVISNIAGLITGDIDPNELIPDFIPISDKTNAGLLIDVLISEINKLRHILPGKTIGIKKF